jgi:hypothetical protein
MMRTILALACLCVAGCATSYEIRSVDAPPPTAASQVVDGILVNRRTAYTVTAQSNFLAPTGAPKLASKAVLNAIDHNHMLSLNICRYPFASGKLATTLNGSQTIEKFGVTSQTGVGRALEAADTSLATKTELEAPKPTPTATPTE